VEIWGFFLDYADFDKIRIYGENIDFFEHMCYNVNVDVIASTAHYKFNLKFSIFHPICHSS